LNRNTVIRCLFNVTVVALYFRNLGSLAKWGQESWPSPHFNFVDRCDHVQASRGRNYTGIKAIFPSVGQTGTTAVIDASRMLGLRAFHTEDVLMYIPYITKPTITPSEYARQTSRCAVEAISVEPFTDAWYIAFLTNPQAKVVITWRNFYSWLRSSSEGGNSKDLRWASITNSILSSVRVLPWLSTLEAFTRLQSQVHAHGEPVSGATAKLTVTNVFFYMAVARELYGWGDTYKRGVFKIWGSEEGYLAVINEVLQNVPQDQLFVFDIKKHGLPELARFFELKGLPEGTLIPRARSKTSFTNDDRMVTNPMITSTALLIGVMLHVANLMFFRLLSHPLLLLVEAILARFKTNQL